MQLTQREAKPKKGTAEMPSPDILIAEVLDTKCGSLQHKIYKDTAGDHGILHMEGIPFVWALEWAKKEGQMKFHLEVWHVRPRSLKLVASRQFKLTKGEIG